MSIIPTSMLTGITINPTPVRLSSATGEAIHCDGQADVKISLSKLRREFDWVFIAADVTHPLLGLDFLQHFGLILDCKKSTISDPLTNCVADLAQSSNCFKINVNNVSALDVKIQRLLKQVPDILLPQSKTRVNTGVYHHIETTTNVPVFAKTRQLSEEKCKAAKAEFQKLLDNGTIQRSKSQWSSPLHIVTKTNGKHRLCGDYRNLNVISKVDRYSIPNINSLSSKLHNKRHFSKIDLVSAYHNIPVYPDDICKTAITTPFGLFEYKYMPFGLRNASATFQRFMDSILANVACTFTYIDDILIFSDSEEQHLNDILTVLKILDTNNLKISLDKCVFNVASIDFLGYNLNADGIKPPESKISQLSNFPYPNNSHALRRFLGMVNYYQKLVPHFTAIVLPLTELIRQFPNSKHLDLTDQQKQACDNIKLALSNLKPLSYPDSNVSNYQLVTDSSQYAVGAALHQMINNEPIPIGFFSHKLSLAQQKYSAYDRELLAAYLSVLHFRHQIEGREVVLITDHKPLVNAFKSQNIPKSDRQQRHLCIISEYIKDVFHISGKENIVADCLSRPALAVRIDTCDLPEIASEQCNDNEINDYKDKLKVYKLNPNYSIYCDVSTSFPRPFVPLTLRKSVFESLHNISHPGIDKSAKLIKSRFYWPNMDRHIREWCRDCIACQQSKVHKHTHSTVSEFSLPSSRFQSVHIDIVGPLPPTTMYNESYPSQYRYLLTCIDRATRWMEVSPMTEITASAVAIAFVNVWISRFGVPLHVITDRGTQFESELFSELSKITGFHRLRTNSYHPQTNGMVERLHRSIKTSLTARKESWLLALPIILLGLRCLPNENGISPFNAVTGTSILMPQLLIDTDENCSDISNEFIRKLCNEMTKIDFDTLSKGITHSNKKSYLPKDLFKCDKVWLRLDRVRKPLEAPYSGPFTVVERNSKYFVIEMSDNVHKTVSIDRLKPCIQNFTNIKSVEVNVNDKECNLDSDNPSVVSCKNSNKSDDNNVPSNVLNDSVPKTVGKERRSRYGRKLTFRSNPDYYYF